MFISRIYKISINQTLSHSDIDRQSFSTGKERKLSRHKRQNTDYKIEMFLIIDYSIYI